MTGQRAGKHVETENESAPARNIVLKLEYCGRDFQGWQIQAGGRTVQGVIKENLEKVIRHEVNLIGAGRTDSGVHALAQYANFRTSNPVAIGQIKHKLNQLLPDDIVIMDCWEATPQFDARRSAVERQYAYLICERPSAIKRHLTWVLGRKLDRGMLDQMAAVVMRGRNFRNFCKSKSLKENSDCRVMSASWRRRNGLLRFEITADRFLHNMVRLLVGTMVSVLDGAITMRQFEKAVLAEINEKAKYIAPACGLYLAAVKYERGIR
ncbi:MAG: tRNA pseudouridine(38-40) synthase TruA [candidate division Zixibacteria bacterium RBG_16_53_22]|nr:MAG: tRNA pseudouridine(38-40) synthase TruA [candidate division Zixibacteria bacterium RBG_16_53_22]